ncbi:MAG: PfkB family carbohydrate kinase, partial [Chloroflexota bacterium]
MTTPEIVGFGALNMDSILQVTEIVTEGEAVVHDVKQYPGGSAANTTYALARLGMSAGFVGAVGNDSNGKKLVHALARVGVDTAEIKTKQAATGTALCLSDTLGRRAIYLHPGANGLLSPQDV